MLATLGPRAERYDAVVVDTAPSRHALELVSLPGRISRLLDSRALQWLGRIAQRGTRRTLAQRVLDWGQEKLVNRFEKALGDGPVSDTLAALNAVMTIRPGLTETIRLAGELLAGPATEHLVVLAPRQGADHEARLFKTALTDITKPPFAWLINRAVDEVPAWALELADAADLDSDLFAAVATVVAESRLAIAAANDAVVAVRAVAAGARVERIPPVDGATPTEVVLGVADHLAGLFALSPRGPQEHRSRGDAGPVAASL